MSIKGIDVVREASDMVLTDDIFASIQYQFWCAIGHHFPRTISN